LKVLLFDWKTDGHHLEYAGHVARFLAESGDEVVFATLGRGPTPDALNILKTHSDVRDLATSRGWWLIKMWRGVFRALKLAKRERVDVVHFLYLDRSELAILVGTVIHPQRALLFGTLFWPYFVQEEAARKNVAKRLFHHASRRCLGYLLERRVVSGLFVHSDRIRSLIAGVLPGGGSIDQIVVVPDPAKKPRDVSTSEAGALLGLPSETPILLFFGGARREKGPDIFLQALVGLGGEWTAVLVGEAGLVGETESDAYRRLLGEPERLVTRFEHVSEVDADAYFRAADVVVLPYRSDFRGTSGILQRAAASGKPVIATDVGDVGPTVREAGLGTVVPADSVTHLHAALAAFLRQPRSAHRAVASRALEHAAANDWRRLGTIIRATYLKYLEDPG
jgi:glycosyltransferase involved in cell wall biosynthesis